MKSFRPLFLIIIVFVVALILIFGPFSYGPGLKGIIEPMGVGPTWVTAGAGRLFISNTISGDIAVYSIGSGEFLRRIEDVVNAGFSYYSPEAGKLFAAMGGKGEGSLLIIKPETLRIPQQINMQVECRGMVASLDGKYLYAIWGGYKEGPGWLTKTKLSDYELAGIGSTRETPTAILLSPDGKKAYVSSHYGQRDLAVWLGDVEGAPEIRSVVEVFDVAGSSDISLIKEIEVGLKPQSMAAFGDGRYIIVAAASFENEDMGLPSFSVINTETDEVIKEIRTPGYAPFIVVTDEVLGMAFATFLYKVPAIFDEINKPEGQSSETESVGITLGNIPESESEEPEYIPMYGRGFLAIHLDDYTVDIYTDERGLPLSSLCILDDHRIIGVSTVANKLAVIEPEF